MDDRVAPFTVPPVGVDSIDPPPRSLRLDLLERIVPLRLEDQLDAVVEPDDEVRHILVRLSIMEVGDPEDRAPGSSRTPRPAGCVSM